MASYWLLRLVPDRRWGRWICGTIIFGVLFGLFATLGPISEESLADRPDIGVALFPAARACGQRGGLLIQSSPDYSPPR